MSLTVGVVCACALVSCVTLFGFGLDCLSGISWMLDPCSLMLGMEVPVAVAMLSIGMPMLGSALESRRFLRNAFHGETSNALLISSRLPPRVSGRYAMHTNAVMRQQAPKRK